jgi:hypothetical protein
MNIKFIYIFIVMLTTFSCKSKKIRRQIREEPVTVPVDIIKQNKRLKNKITRSVYFYENPSQLELVPPNIKTGKKGNILVDLEDKDISKWSYLDICFMDKKDSGCKYEHKSFLLQEILYPLSKGEYFIKVRVCARGDDLNYKCGSYSQIIFFKKEEDSDLSSKKLFSHLSNLEKEVDKIYQVASGFFVYLKYNEDRIKSADKNLFSLGRVESSFANFLAVDKYEMTRQIYYEGPIYQELLKGFVSLRKDLGETQEVDSSACIVSSTQITAIVGVSVLVVALAVLLARQFRKSKKSSSPTAMKEQSSFKRFPNILGKLKRSNKKGNSLVSKSNKVNSLGRLLADEDRTKISSQEIEGYLSEVSQDLENFMFYIVLEKKEIASILKL